MDSSLLLIKYLLACASVLLLIYLCAKLLQKFSQKNFSNDVIKIISRKFLDSKSSLCLIEVEEKKFLVVFGANQVQICPMEKNISETSEALENNYSKEQALQFLPRK